MKQLFFFLLAIAGSLVFTSAHAQVRVNAHIGVGAPAPVVVYERDYPGYAYYTYPAWNGHYRDRFYYEHYRPAFEREHRGYFHGRRFDHDRYERDRRYRGHDRRRYDDRRDHHRD